jgi:hypothetical protein
MIMSSTDMGPWYAERLKIARELVERELATEAKRPSATEIAKMIHDVDRILDTGKTKE